MAQQRVKIQSEGETVGWFDPSKANSISERTDFDGSNEISKATGSQFEHELLHYTAGGSWVLEHWSNIQGRLETYTLLSDADAVKWLISIEATDEDLQELPEDIRKGVLKEFEKYEH